MRIAVTFTNGISQAHTPDREVEWPPHPERLLEGFLAGAWRLGGDIAHRDAVRTLEGISPKIHVTSAVGQDLPPPLRHFGRYIETSGKIFESECSHWKRSLIVGPGTHVIYEYDLPEDRQRDTLLREVMSAVYYLGSSASSATFQFTDSVPEEMKTYIPATYRSGECATMRVPSRGRIEILESAYARRSSGVAMAMATTGMELEGKGTKSAREIMNARDSKNEKAAGHHWRSFSEHGDRVLLQQYRMLDSPNAPLQSPWEMRTVFLTEVLAIDGTNFEDILATFRSTWLNLLRLNHPALSGHEADGAPTRQPHAGFFPVLDVNRPYAAGKLLGISLFLPRHLDPELRSEALAALQRINHISWNGANLQIEHEYAVREREKGNPRQSRRIRILNSYSKQYSDTWATVTPAMPYHHTKPGESRTRPDAVRAALMHMIEIEGLPRPLDIAWGPASVIPGAPHSSSVLYNGVHKGSAKVLHLVVKFEKPIKGPILIGRRMWKGYGICIPWN